MNTLGAAAGTVLHQRCRGAAICPVNFIEGRGDGAEAAVKHAAFYAQLVDEEKGEKVRTRTWKGGEGGENRAVHAHAIDGDAEFG